MTRAGGDAPDRWADLGPRAATSAALAACAIAAIWAGGLVFKLFAAVCVGLIVWELAMMVRSSVPRLLAGVAALCCLAVTVLPPGWGLPLLILPLLVGIGRVGTERITFAVFAELAVLAGYGIVHLRDDLGVDWLLWLTAVVVVTDVVGYFAGRLIGGPKFWPRVSPKKTWSGTAAGWVAAALVGVSMTLWGGAEAAVIAISVSVAMASQFGDIAQSALKRRVGVKDSSTLLPGHGGFFDRFDGVLGATVFLLLIEQVADFPPVAA